MISKSKLKELSVYKQQKRCDEERVFVVEGVKMCGEALAANLPIRVLCATNSWLAQHPSLPSSAQVFEADCDALERLSNFRTPNEVWLLAERPNFQFLNFNFQLSIALDHLQDPGNMGTIIRTCDWFGIRHIVCSEGTVSCYNPKVVQSTMGGLFRTMVEYTDLPQYLASCGRPVLGAVLDGDNIWDAGHPLRLPGEGAVLVIGNESRGISPEVQRHLTRRLLIPNLGGTAESLNASVACAILIAQLLQKQ